MACTRAYHRADKTARRRRAAARGFTLIELMTVIFIIGLLIGILIPSLTAARNAAKRTTTAAMVKVLETGLEMFKNDHARDFRQTNGYPPSFAHPPILGTDGRSVFDPLSGQFPFLESSGRTPPRVYGAHWLPAMLIGVDALGVVSRRAVPPALRSEPRLWYASDPLADGSGPLERSPLYVDPTGLKLTRTEELPGAREEPNFFPDYDEMKNLPVIADPFEQPILYYASNTYGKTANMLEDERNAGNVYDGRPPPFYFHQDNEGFTGDDNEDGWNLGGGGHAIARSGSELDATNIDGTGPGAGSTGDRGETFARFIHDGKAHQAIANPTASAPLQPFNPKTFLLISAGRDGRYGTVDDVTNFPLFSD